MSIPRRSLFLRCRTRTHSAIPAIETDVAHVVDDQVVL
jgi:hypothetical protein